MRFFIFHAIMFSFLSIIISTPNALASPVDLKPTPLPDEVIISHVDGKDDPSSIPIESATWIFYQSLQFREEQSLNGGKHFLEKVVGLSAEEAKGFIGEVQRAIAVDKHQHRQFANELCRSLSIHQMTRDDLFNELQAIEDKANLKRHSMIGNAIIASTSESRIKIKNWVEENMITKIVHTELNYSEMAKYLNIEKEIVIEKLCNPSTGNANLLLQND